MSFYEIYQQYSELDLAKVMAEITADQVMKTLEKSRQEENSLRWRDFLTLLSPQAENYLEEMARQAQLLTRKNFGRVVFIYAPLYLSNYCVNNCSYCGFNTTNHYQRRKLSLAELREEAEVIAAKGIKDILILTGESRKHTPVSYLKDCVEILKEYFSAIAIEIYPLTVDEYRQLIELGVDGLTVYQEVYNQEIYDRVHLAGPKKDYNFRLNALERGCQAGIRRINLGPLLGLDDWRREVFFTGIHAEYLQKKYLDKEISLSVPRLRPHLSNLNTDKQLATDKGESNKLTVDKVMSNKMANKIRENSNIVNNNMFKAIAVNDKNLVQTILAYRLFLPRAGINLSTRENSALRDNLLPLGITKMSAESNTIVGGYSSDGGTAQFEIADNRTVTEIKELLVQKGYQPVFQDWHHL